MSTINPSINQAVTQSSEKLAHVGIENPKLEAELLAAHVLGVNLGRLRVLEIMGAGLDEAQHERLSLLISERCDRVPLQHLTGKAPFRTIELDVGPGVFIPRPETETVVQFAIDELIADASAQPIVVDLCTGSGAIALAIANEVINARVWAIERESEAHAWAQRNVKNLGDDRVTLLQADITDKLEVFDQLEGKVSVVISNPPYVPSEAIPRQIEARDHDPQAALYSGADGLDLIRSISKVAKPLLRPGGLLVLEHAEHQGSSVRDILVAAGWHSASTHRDLTLRDRVTIARA